MYLLRYLLQPLIVNILLIKRNLLGALVTDLHYLTNKCLLGRALLAVVHVVGARVQCSVVVPHCLHQALSLMGQ